jgi:hypothetical protein
MFPIMVDKNGKNTKAKKKKNRHFGSEFKTHIQFCVPFAKTNAIRPHLRMSPLT